MQKSCLNCDNYSICRVCDNAQIYMQSLAKVVNNNNDTLKVYEFTAKNCRLYKQLSED